MLTQVITQQERDCFNFSYHNIGQCMQFWYLLGCPLGGALILFSARLSSLFCGHSTLDFFQISSPPPPLNPGGQKVNIQLFQNMVMLHIKL